MTNDAFANDSRSANDPDVALQNHQLTINPFFVRDSAENRKLASKISCDRSDYYHTSFTEIPQGTLWGFR